MTETPGTYKVSQGSSTCALCGLPESRFVWSSPLALAVWDGFPVSLGHALVVPRRHTAAWDDLTVDEKAAILAGIDAVRARIADEHCPGALTTVTEEGVYPHQTLKFTVFSGSLMLYK